MAKGNIGNLLQHFITLRVAQKLVKAWGNIATPIEFIDCYSMAPWEKIDKSGQPQGFVNLVEQFPNQRDQGDFVAKVFLEAWKDHYLTEKTPKHPRERDYPNTAVLIRKAFANQSFNMRLHENDLVDKTKNERLSNWAREQKNCRCDVAGDWTKSQLILNNPAPLDRAVLITLDPYQIVNDDNRLANHGGYLTQSLLRLLFGSKSLNILERPSIRHAKPLVITAFSYSDRNPDNSDEIIRQIFSRTWDIEIIKSGPRKHHGKDSWHVGWIISNKMDFPVLKKKAQKKWDTWSSFKG